VTSSPSHQALYRRWRAQTFGQIVGQEPVVETLRNAVRLGRVSHAILFVGPRGTGKTSLARIVAKAVNCTDLRDGDPCDACPSCTSIRDGRALDLVEIDAASNRGIDAIRDLRERIHYAPTDLRRKVYILDEAHQITKDAWNALLKSLEEPPDSVLFIFASTHPQEFPPAILSRLQRYDVRRLTVPEIEGKLRRIIEADGREADEGAVRLVARLAAGGMRDAESMLDQLLASTGDGLDETRVRDLLGLVPGDAVERFVDALVGGDPRAGIAVLDDLEDHGRDARVFLDQVVEALRTQLVAALSGDGRHHADAIAAAGRRLAAIDPNRAGVGGLRLQLELALFAPVGRVAASSAFAAPPVDGSMPARATPPVRAPAVTSVAAAPVSPPAETASTPEAAPAPLAASPGKTTPARSVSSGTSPTSPSSGPAAAPPLDQATADTTAEAGPDGSTGPASRPRERSAEPSAPAPTPVTANTDLERLRARWPEVVVRISQHPPTKPLISACRPISVDGDVVTLGFPEDQAFLKDVAERRRSILESGVGEFVGRPVRVRCVATNLDLIPPLPAEPDAAFLLAEARRIFADELVDVGEVG
jgi:DNA polymerase-3 subunit gamma/tau